MFRRSELEAKAKASEEHRALQSRAFDRVIASQLAKVKGNKPIKKVETEEEFKANLAIQREEAAQRGGERVWVGVVHLRFSQFSLLFPLRFVLSH